MREKPVSAERVEKYKSFLLTIYDFAKAGNDSTPLWQVVKIDGVSSGVPKVLYEMGIIKKDPVDKIKWHWLVEKPNKELALRVLDTLLHKNKKTLHVPIPGLSDIADSLKSIVERLNDVVYVQNRKRNTGLKNGLKSNDNEPDLFRVEDQRLYLVGQIAGDYFKEGRYNDDGIEAATEYVIKIADVLLNKLRNNGKISD